MDILMKHAQEHRECASCKWVACKEIARAICTREIHCVMQHTATAIRTDVALVHRVEGMAAAMRFPHMNWAMPSLQRIICPVMTLGDFSILPLGREALDRLATGDEDEEGGNTP